MYMCEEEWISKEEGMKEIKKWVGQKRREWFKRIADLKLWREKPWVLARRLVYWGRGVRKEFRGGVQKSRDAVAEILIKAEGKGERYKALVLSALLNCEGMCEEKNKRGRYEGKKKAKMSESRVGEKRYEKEILEKDKVGKKRKTTITSEPPKTQTTSRVLSTLQLGYDIPGAPVTKLN